MRPFLAIWTALFLAASPEAMARWATPDDADFVTERIRHEVRVSKDGTFRSETESLVTILREGARRMSNYRLGYNSRASRFKVLEAATINEGKRFYVESEFIEDKPQASRVNGFDQMNLVTVAFPKVGIGSKLHIKYSDERRETAVPGHYSQRFELGLNWFVKDYTARIVSEMPLRFEKNDPNGVIEVTQSKKDDDEYETVIRLARPLYTRAVDEPWVSISQKDRSWVVVSSSTEWPELADALARKYEEVLGAELPDSYRRILDKAKGKSGMVERLNTITSALADEVRYMGDWRPVAGGFVPRPLETVAKTRFGDCKDFSAATVAILRKLGVKANVAFVERAIQPTPLTKVPYTAAFNHAIVWASAEGRDWWIDPTNFASFAQGVFTDIIDRRSLVVSTAGSFLGTIPPGRPSEAVRETVARVRVLPDGDAEIDARLLVTGRSASGYTGALMRQSKEHVDHVLITSLVDENRLKWRSIGDYDLSSRVTKDVAIRVRWGESSYAMRTTVGPAFYLEQRAVDQLLRIETKKRVSDLFLGSPETLRSIDLLEDVRMVGAKAPQCQLDTPWVRITRKITQTGKGLKILDEKQTKKSLITIDELKSPAFAKFQAALQKCFDRVAVVFKPAGAPRGLSSEK